MKTNQGVMRASNLTRMRTHSLVTLFAFLHFEICVSQEFDSHFTGVTFNPYIKNSSNDTFPKHSTYTTEDVRVMLEVITERFSKVSTLRTVSKSGPYVHNITHYEERGPEIYIAEIAATINKNRGWKVLTIQQGVRVQSGPQMHMDTLLAIECAEKANKIFPGTVDSLVFPRIHKNYDEQLLNNSKIAKESSRKNFEVGVKMNLNKLWKFRGNSERKKYLGLLLQNFDFIVCEIDPSQVFESLGAEAAFYSFAEWLPPFRKYLQNSNPKINVMIQIKWDSETDSKSESVENLKIYWNIANEWAKKNNFTVWFFEAFDCPEDAFYNGWWRLSDNSKINQKEGYIEIILEGNDPPVATTMSTEAIVKITVGSLLLLIFIFVTTFVIVRIKKLEHRLSNKDIWDFMHGISEEDMAYHDDPVNTKIALQFSYDMSFEIQLHKLKIHYDQILGTGQFGCVFKAIIESSRETGRHVALKVAKPDCPRNTLKGLLSEIKVLSYIGQHPNIVLFEGAYTAELRKGIVYIATEYCCLGSMQAYLRKQDISEITDRSMEERRTSPTYINTSEPIDFWQMVRWSQEIACGMEYLGTQNVVHADLATRNVLLNEEKIAKICDFGLSRRMYEYANYNKSDEGPLPWRWMAIESLKRGEFSTKSDVWSYGVTLWEIFEMGNIPFPGLTWTSDFVTMLVQGLRLSRPSHASPEIFELMTDCWQAKSDERPSFSEIKQTIESIVIEGKISRESL